MPSLSKIRPDNRTRRLGANGHRPLAPTGSEPALNSLPKFWRDDRLVLAGVDFLLVRDVAPIKPVLQHQVKRAAREALAAGKLSVGSLPSLAHDAGPLELCLQQRDRAKLGVAPEDIARLEGYAEGGVWMAGPDLTAADIVAYPSLKLLLRASRRPEAVPLALGLDGSRHGLRASLPGCNGWSSSQAMRRPIRRIGARHNVPSFGHFIRIGRADDDHPGNRAQRDDLLDRRQI